MTFKNNFISACLIAATIVFLLACGQSRVDKKVTKANNKLSELQALTIDTFSIFPPEIDGCSCYFSNDSAEFKKAVYIYMNDYAQTSFLKINNVLTKFTQTEFKEIDKTTTVAKAKSDNYEIIIEVKYIKQNRYETYLNSGTIKIKDKKGNTLTKTFYGECGC